MCLHSSHTQEGFWMLSEQLCCLIKIPVQCCSHDVEIEKIEWEDVERKKVEGMKKEGRGERKITLYT